MGWGDRMDDKKFLDAILKSYTKIINELRSIRKDLEGSKDSSSQIQKEIQNLIENTRNEKNSEDNSNKILRNTNNKDDRNADSTRNVNNKDKNVGSSFSRILNDKDTSSHRYQNNTETENFKELNRNEDYISPKKSNPLEKKRNAKNTPEKGIKNKEMSKESLFDNQRATDSYTSKTERKLDKNDKISTLTKLKNPEKGTKMVISTESKNTEKNAKMKSTTEPKNIENSKKYEPKIADLQKDISLDLKFGSYVKKAVIGSIKHSNRINRRQYEDVPNKGSNHKHNKIIQTGISFGKAEGVTPKDHHMKKAKICLENLITKNHSHLGRSQNNFNISGSLNNNLHLQKYTHDQKVPYNQYNIPNAEIENHSFAMKEKFGNPKMLFTNNNNEKINTQETLQLVKDLSTNCLNDTFPNQQILENNHLMRESIQKNQQILNIPKITIERNSTQLDDPLFFTNTEIYDAFHNQKDISGQKQSYLKRFGHMRDTFIKTNPNICGNISKICQIEKIQNYNSKQNYDNTSMNPSQVLNKAVIKNYFDTDNSNLSDYPFRNSIICNNPHDVISHNFGKSGNLEKSDQQYREIGNLNRFETDELAVFYQKMNNTYINDQNFQRRYIQYAMNTIQGIFLQIETNDSKQNIQKNIHILNKIWTILNLEESLRLIRFTLGFKIIVAQTIFQYLDRSTASDFLYLIQKYDNINKTSYLSYFMNMDSKINEGMFNSDFNDTFQNKSIKEHPGFFSKFSQSNVLNRLGNITRVNESREMMGTHYYKHLNLLNGTPNFDQVHDKRDSMDTYHLKQAHKLDNLSHFDQYRDIRDSMDTHHLRQAHVLDNLPNSYLIKDSPNFTATQHINKICSPTTNIILKSQNTEHPTKDEPILLCSRTDSQGCHFGLNTSQSIYDLTDQNIDEEKVSTYLMSPSSQQSRNHEDTFENPKEILYQRSHEDCINLIPSFVNDNRFEKHESMYHKYKNQSELLKDSIHKKNSSHNKSDKQLQFTTQINPKELINDRFKQNKSIKDTGFDIEFQKTDDFENIAPKKIVIENYKNRIQKDENTIQADTENNKANLYRKDLKIEIPESTFCNLDFQKENFEANLNQNNSGRKPKSSREPTTFLDAIDVSNKTSDKKYSETQAKRCFDLDKNQIQENSLFDYRSIEICPKYAKLLKPIEESSGASKNPK